MIPAIPKVVETPPPATQKAEKSRYSYIPYNPIDFKKHPLDAIVHFICNAVSAIFNALIWLANGASSKSLKERVVTVEKPLQDAPDHEGNAQIAADRVKKATGDVKEALNETDAALNENEEAMLDLEEAAALRAAALEEYAEALLKKGYTKEQIQVFKGLVLNGQKELLEKLSKTCIESAALLNETAKKEIGRDLSQEEMQTAVYALFERKKEELLFEAAKKALENLFNQDPKNAERLKKELDCVGEADFHKHPLMAFLGLSFGITSSIGLFYLAGLFSQSLATPAIDFLTNPSFSYVKSGLETVLPAATAQKTIDLLKWFEFNPVKKVYRGLKQVISYVNPLAEQLPCVPSTLPWYHEAPGEILSILGLAMTARRAKNWGKTAFTYGSRLFSFNKLTALSFYPATRFIYKGVKDYFQNPEKAVKNEQVYVARDFAQGYVEKWHAGLCGRFFPEKALDGNAPSTKKTYDSAKAMGQMAGTVALFAYPILTSLASYII